jgi:hypothetical protein
MTLLAPNVGDAQLLGIALNKNAQENQILKLFTNNKVPAKGDTAANYTEAAGNGYAAIPLTGANWSIALAGSPSVETASYAMQEFDFTGALGNVYGYFIVGAISGILLWAEAFTGGPFNVTGSQTPIQVTPQITLN